MSCEYRLFNYYFYSNDQQLFSKMKILHIFRVFLKNNSRAWHYRTHNLVCLSFDRWRMSAITSLYSACAEDGGITPKSVHGLSPSEEKICHDYYTYNTSRFLSFSYFSVISIFMLAGYCDFSQSVAKM